MMPEKVISVIKEFNKEMTGSALAKREQSAWVGVSHDHQESPAVVSDALFIIIKYKS